MLLKLLGIAMVALGGIGFGYAINHPAILADIDTAWNIGTFIMMSVGAGMVFGR
jgi:hypothetical protein